MGNMFFIALFASAAAERHMRGNVLDIDRSVSLAERRKGWSLHNNSEVTEILERGAFNGRTWKEEEGRPSDHFFSRRAAEARVEREKEKKRKAATHEKLLEDKKKKTTKTI
jgi:hypothetical protein